MKHVPVLRKLFGTWDLYSKVNHTRQLFLVRSGFCVLHSIILYMIYLQFTIVSAPCHVLWLLRTMVMELIFDIIWQTDMFV